MTQILSDLRKEAGAIVIATSDAIALEVAAAQEAPELVAA
jgi:hypothetical protein